MLEIVMAASREVLALNPYHVVSIKPSGFYVNGKEGCLVMLTNQDVLRCLNTYEDLVKKFKLANKVLV